VGASVTGIPGRIARALFHPPVFEDEERTGRAAVLFWVAWAIEAGSVLSLPLIAFTPSAAVRLLSQVAFMALVAAPSMIILTRRGHLDVAAYSLCVLAWAFLTFSAWTGGGLDAPVSAGFLVLVVLAGSLLGWRYLLATAVGCTLTVFALALAERGGLLSAPVVAGDPLARATAMAMYAATAAGIMAIILFNLERARTISDIEVGERRASESALARQAGMYARAEEAALAGSWRWDLRSRKVEWSDGMFRLYGIDKDGFDGDVDRVVESRVHPDDLPAVRAANAAVLGEGRPTPMDYRVVLPDGAVRVVHAEGSLVLDDAGEVIGLAGYVQDITEREAEHEALQESERFIQSILDTTPNLVYIYDIVENRNIYANREVSAFLGYTPEQILDFGSALFESILHPDDASLVGEHHGRMAGAPDGVVMDVEYRMRHSDREWRWLRSRDVVFARDAGGAVTRILGTTEDITEQKHQEAAAADRTAELETLVRQRTAELMKSNEVLEEANTSLAAATRAKNEFLASMSHELRTPLNSIIGFSGTLLLGLTGPLEPEQEKQVRMINSSGQHLLEIINDVLDLSVIEAGRLRIGTAPLELAELVENTAGSIQPLAAEKGLDLSWHVALDADAIVSDRVRLEQVLINLLGNAVKFTECGSVRLSVFREADTMVLAVSDTGIGIAQEDLERVFEEFYQVPRYDVAKSPGTGLGLAVSRRLVDALGGTIEVDSTLGEGTTFTVRLPAGA
jgi:PAS domain S-box-containing protein